MTKEKLTDAFLAYIERDLAVCENDYVYDCLKLGCLLTDDEIEELGLGFLIPDKEDT